MYEIPVSVPIAGRIDCEDAEKQIRAYGGYGMGILQAYTHAKEINGENKQYSSIETGNRSPVIPGPGSQMPAPQPEQEGPADYKGKGKPFSRCGDHAVSPEKTCDAF